MRKVNQIKLAMSINNTEIINEITIHRTILTKISDKLPPNSGSQQD